MRTYTFSILRNKKRIDVLLASLFPKLSRSFLQHLIKRKLVLINGFSTSSHHIPKYRDSITISIPALQQLGIIPVNIPLDILYEDADIIVLNKPAGIVVHPSDNGGHISNSIVNALAFYYKSNIKTAKNLRPGIVHRLDKDTSGVLVVAKHDDSLSFLAKQWEKREVSKEYVVLVKGHISPQKGIIEAPLGRSGADRKKMSVQKGKSGRYALTEYEVLEYFNMCSLLKVKILTGRTHQIRVHLQSIGHPVVGDETYGNAKINSLFAKEYGLQRQFLHASTLGFYLPSTKKRTAIEAPLSEDLQKVIKRLKGSEKKR